MSIVDRALRPSHSGAIPLKFNRALAAFFTAANLNQFFLLPLFLLSYDLVWAWTLVPLALLNNSFWSLLHEAIHDLFSPSRSLIRSLGGCWRFFLARLFAFCDLTICCTTSLTAARPEARNIMIIERHQSARGAGIHLQNFGDWYLIEVISTVRLFLARRWIKHFKDRHLTSDTVSGILVQNWRAPEALREIRVDGSAITALLSMSLFCYGTRWPYVRDEVAGVGAFSPVS